MKRALVVGASGGIGSAISAELHTRGWEVTGVSRSRDGLDVCDEASVATALAALSGPFHLVFVATGALVVDGHEPEKAVREITGDGLLEQMRINALGPMLVLKHALPLLAREERAVFAALSARVGSIGDNRIGGWHSYRAAKAALNQLVHGAAIELKRTHKRAIAVCLHPGTVETPFTAKYAGRHKTVSAPEAAANLLDVVETLGTAQSGGFFDYAGREIPW
ncbi:MAG: SDR family NAD(P)-dependent oxidoreductase [Silicimonas sp.]|jgi:NAD(P)-dependent dehydrogenase (short-subunit alcohol dehydrogenase family)|nr:SDR family NAD(P)-dependent oxidoreductase [Silicimonas sp.]